MSAEIVYLAARRRPEPPPPEDEQLVAEVVEVTMLARRASPRDRAAVLAFLRVVVEELPGA